MRVVGLGYQEPGENLDKMMCKFKEHGLTLNYKSVSLEPRAWGTWENCSQGKGCRSPKKRVAAIVDAPRLQNQSEVSSFHISGKENSVDALIWLPVGPAQDHDARGAQNMSAA